MKATKNRAELAGARAAHERDGAAMARFLAWLAVEAPRGRLTEIDAVKALETFRRASVAMKDISFPTIAAAGPNSAIPHYRVSEASNRRIGRGIFLVDSGAQYEDGTTDITRTIAVGRPSSLMRDRFTRVLKGHIAIARAVFPAATSGAQIDALARTALWRKGLDFDHGTGHGVGSYLSVHEGPQRLAKTGTTALAPGMIISNEPGYYAAGAFGIRTENLVAVETRAIAGGERPMLGFETLTLAPIDLSLVEPKLMDGHEIAWLDDYHARVRKVLAPLVDAPTRRWLMQATRRFAPRKGSAAARRSAPLAGSALCAPRPGRERPKRARRQNLSQLGFAANARARQANRRQPSGYGLRGPAFGLHGQSAPGRHRQLHKLRLASGVERPALIHLEPQPMQQRQPRDKPRDQIVGVAALMEESHR